MVIMLFGFIFIASMVAIAGMLVSEQKILSQKVDSEKSFQIAEAGLNNYRWLLAHDNEDDAGLDEDFYDPEGTLIGHYTVEVTEADLYGGGGKVTICHKEGTPAEKTLKIPQSALAAHIAHGDYEGECDDPATPASTNIVALTATGWTLEHPNTKRKIRVRYGRPSLAKYAFITNSNVWFGDDEEVVGLVHSNGGIRMDGACNSRMTSIKPTYICGPEHDCADEEKPGIWGTGEKEELWDFPIADGVDFDAITVDLNNIETEAIADGEYIGDPAIQDGYILDFSDNGTFEVRKINKFEDPVWGYNGVEWVEESHSYKNSSHVATHSIPDNGLVFVADDVWVEGVVDGRVTVAAARLPDGDYEDASIYIQNDLTYAVRDGTNVMGLIAQQDILVPLYSPENLTIDAALLAQKGHVYRYYYPNSWYSPYAIQDTIETYGTIITNTIWTWSWVSGAGGTTISGYENTDTIYDTYLLYGPPPSFPSEEEYEFLSWEEVLPNEVD